MIGRKFNYENIHKSKKIIENEFNPLNDMRASSQYRTLVSKNLIERFYLEIKNSLRQAIIAQQNGVSINDIRKWNKLKNDKLSVGKKLVLFIKDDFKTTTQKKVENPVYIVKQGDTLWDIANKFDGISVSELMKHNNLNSNQLKPGEKILLPTS